MPFISMTYDSAKALAVRARVAGIRRDVAAGGQINQALDDGAEVIADWIKYGLLSGRVLKVRSGNLRDSVHVERQGPFQVSVVQDDAAAPYGPMQELGVPHPWVILPKSARALRFEIGGKVFFAKRVVHPGLEARPFMSRGMSDKRAAAFALIEAAVEKSVNGQ